MRGGIGSIVGCPAHFSTALGGRGAGRAGSAPSILSSTLSGATSCLASATSCSTLLFTPKWVAMADVSIASFEISCSANKLICKSRSARLSAAAAIRFCVISTKVDELRCRRLDRMARYRTELAEWANGTSAGPPNLKSGLMFEIQHSSVGRSSIMKNRLLESLPASEQAWVASFFLDRTFEKGSVLQEAGQPVDQVYFPKSGLVTLLGVLPGGAQIDTAIVGSEGAIGAAVGIGMQKAFGRAVVQIPGRFAQISAVRFAEWASRSKAVRDMILRYNEELIAHIQHSVVCTAVHDSQARLCRWLLQAGDRVDNETLSLTQERLSGILGLQRTTITLICHKLQTEGILRVRRGRIDILNIAALRAKACECYDVMHSLTGDAAHEPLQVPQMPGISLAVVQDGPGERAPIS